MSKLYSLIQAGTRGYLVLVLTPVFKMSRVDCSSRLNLVDIPFIIDQEILVTDRDHERYNTPSSDA